MNQAKEKSTPSRKLAIDSDVWLLSVEKVARAFERLEAGEKIYQIAHSYRVSAPTMGSILERARRHGFAVFSGYQPSPWRS